MPINTANKTVKAGSTTYFFDIKETKGGKLYLVITESRFKGRGVSASSATSWCFLSKSRNLAPH